MSLISKGIILAHLGHSDRVRTLYVHLFAFDSAGGPTFIYTPFTLYLRSNPIFLNQFHADWFNPQI